MKTSDLSASAAIPDSRNSDALPASADSDFVSKGWSGAEYVHSRIIEDPASVGGGSSGNHVAEVGLTFFRLGTHPDQGTIPAHGSGLDRGMINKTFTDVTPNTTYQFTARARVGGSQTTIRVGIFDAENTLYDAIEAPQIDINSTTWAPVSLLITTGPRTTRLDAFCINISGLGPGYCDDFAITRIGAAAAPQEAPLSFTTPPERGDAAFPITIPAVQAFTPAAADRFVPGRSLTVIVDSAAPQLIDEAERFASGLPVAGLMEDVVVVPGSRRGGSNTVFLTLRAIDLTAAPAKAKALSGDAYMLAVDKAGVTITAGGEAGAQYALQTLTQALKAQEYLPVGTVIDWTDNQFRGVQVDAARRYYSVDWLKNLLSDMAYLKLNTLYLRVKDGQGLRVESAVAPALVNDIEGRFLTKAEVADLVQFARARHIEIIPEVDTPGHSHTDTLVYPHYQLVDQFGRRSAMYDFSKPEVRGFVKQLLNEVGATFDAKYIHIGGDEAAKEIGFGTSPQLVSYGREMAGPQGTVWDGYNRYMNELIASVIADGRQPIMWNDNVDPTRNLISIDKRVIIAFWAMFNRSPEASIWLNSGYQLLNSSSSLYHDLWPSTDKIDRPNPLFLYERWNSWHYSGGYSADIPVDRAATGHRGAVFSIWNDAHGWAPESVLDLTLYPRLRIFAQKAWASPDPVEGIMEYDPYVRWVGHAPAWRSLGQFSLCKDST